MSTEARFGGGQYSFQWSSALSGSLSGAFVLVAWAAIYFGTKQHELLQREQSRLQAAEATARDAQLLALRYQLQPHFLFNTLNAISSLVVAGQPEVATKMIARLGDLLRSTLSEPEVHFVTLSDELELVREYLSIEELRFGPRLRVVVEVDQQASATLVPRFFLQPLIENAVRHGVSQMPDAGAISLSAINHEEQLTIRVENRAPDLSNTVVKASGLGLSNSRKRLEQIYGDAATISEERTSGVFVVTIVIPDGPRPQRVGFR